MKTSSQNIRLIFGLKLRQLRLDQGLNLSQLSAKAGISVSYLNEIEKGKKYPKPEKIGKLATSLNVPYDELVSLRLTRNLSPITQLIETNVLSELPLDFFGIGQGELIELLSVAPLKLSAFVDSIIQIARKYDIQVEQFFYSVMRSYQEMHDNYFPELESAAREFREELGLIPGNYANINILQRYLTQTDDYEVVPDGLADYQELKDVSYAIKKQGKKTWLLLNPNLNETQRLFILGREAGFKYLNLKIRSYAPSWIGANSFEEVLNNFKAHYFSSAILLHERIFLRGLMNFISQKKFDANGVIQLIESTACSPETFLLRITSLVPRYLKFTELFFFRYNHDLQDDTYRQTKEMYASGLRQETQIDLFSKSCQRYAAITSLSGHKHDAPTTTVYDLNYDNSDFRFLIVGIAGNMSPSEHQKYFVGIGFRINDRFRKWTKFVDDKAIPRKSISKQWIMDTSDKCIDGLENIEAFDRNEAMKSIRTTIESLQS